MLRCHHPSSALRNNSQSQSLGTLFPHLFLGVPSAEWHSVSRDLEPELWQVCPVNDPFIYDFLGSGICPQLWRA